ncbi:MAG: hypothetical protein MJE68_05240 [Proteobacteria bacterium]|nr:hypothetical protein [Pseudomonadota bacterium]
MNVYSKIRTQYLAPELLLLAVVMWLLEQTHATPPPPPNWGWCILSTGTRQS